MVYDLLSKICGPRDPSFSKNEGSKSKGWFGDGLFGNSTSESSAFAISMEMVSGAELIYTFAELRELARSGAANSSIENLEAPMTAEKMIEMIALNKDALIATGNYKNLDNKLADLQKKHVKRRGMPSLVEFVDNKANKEMVHAITINDSKKRITVVFRGSVTTTDFMTDAKIVHKNVENPVRKTLPNASETVDIHTGFYEYLFKLNKETKKTRYETIIETIKKLLMENPGYSLYCTGHSLGGALCTLFGFYAAADEEIQSLLSDSVHVISVASPLLGNIEFLLAFQLMERKKKIQHLRITNAEDLVTLGPMVAPTPLSMVSPLAAAVSGNQNSYKHCGIQLRLKEGKNGNPPTHRFKYPLDHATDDQVSKEFENRIQDGRKFFQSLKLAVSKDFVKVLNYHSCDEYESRLIACKEDLTSRTIDDLYADKSIVEDMMNPDYEPVILTRFDKMKKAAGFLQTSLKKSK